MPIQIPNPITTTFSSNTVIGYDLNFQDQGVFNPTFTTFQQLKANMINFILTEPGERVMQPDFGLGLNRFVFNNIDDKNIEEINYFIKERVKQYFPNIEVNNISFKDTNSSLNQISINITFRELSSNTQDEITLIV
jgi:phage baseplate assembly protein W